ncbi:L-aspartate oxidase, partial [Candidatus Margulisiibacteriota bacterium]
MEIKHTDFLIIGSGIAGLTAAIKLSEYGKVTVLTKAAIADGSTSLAQGGIASAISPGDNPQSHLQDTLIAGAGICDQAAVEVLVNEGILRVKELMEWGVMFDREPSGELALGREGAHSCNRIVHAGDATGQAVEDTLIKKISKKKSVTICSQTAVVSLISDSDTCYGAITANGTAYFSSSIIIATGGIGQLYKNTSNPQVVQGDGIVLAYQAGAELIDLEFIQFHPTGFLLPINDTPNLALISEAARGEGAVLRNVFRQKFVDELAPRDIVTRAIFQEMQKTN